MLDLNYRQRDRQLLEWGVLERLEVLNELFNVVRVLFPLYLV